MTQAWATAGLILQTSDNGISIKFLDRVLKFPQDVIIWHYVIKILKIHWA